MIYPNEQVRCVHCRKIFCCAQCRLKHEKNEHPAAIAENSTDNHNQNDEKSRKIENSQLKKIECVICEGKPLAQYENLSEKLLQHICDHHLPLHCKKCDKVYSSRENILKFSHCTNIVKQNCQVIIRNEIVHHQIITVEDKKPDQQPMADDQEELANKSLMASGSSDNNANLITPITKIETSNKKGKCFDRSPMDSITASLRNVSSINAEAHTSMLNPPSQALAAVTDSKGGKLVRTTSTPMQSLITSSERSATNHSSCQVSGIYTSGSESEVSPPIKSVAIQCTPSSMEKLSKLPSSVTRARNKMRVSATPLRQVLSKSIQRAIIEHGYKGYRDSGLLPKKMFNSMDRSASLSTPPPLDLRTSPVIRRTQSETQPTSNYNNQNYRPHCNSSSSSFEDIFLQKSKNCEIFSSTKRLGDSKENTSPSYSLEKLDTVYETCCNNNNIQEGRTSSLSSTSVRYETASTNSWNAAATTENSEAFTPKFPSDIVGFLPKKVISFECPPSFTTPRENFRIEKKKSTVENDDDDNDEVFYTPKSFPSGNFSFTRNIKKNNDEIVSEKKVEKSKTGTGFWNLLTSVVRFASSVSSNCNEKIQLENVKTSPASLLKRCASFAEVINRKKSSEDETDDDQRPSKRRRTSTVSSLAPTAPFSNDESFPKRIRRIQGRPALERMRKKT